MQILHIKLNKIVLDRENIVKGALRGKLKKYPIRRKQNQLIHNQKDPLVWIDVGLFGGCEKLTKNTFIKNRSHFLAHNTTCLVICHFFADFFVPFSRKLGEKPLFSVYNLLHNFSTTVIIETTVSCSFSEKSQRCLMPNIKKLIYKNFQKLSGFSFVQFSGNTCDIQYVPAAW